MKKVLQLLLILSFCSSSCKKSIEKQVSYVYVDTPPTELIGSPGKIYPRWIEKTDADSAVNKGTFCISGICDTWFEVSSRTYWGKLDGVIYLSVSYAKRSIRERVLHDAKSIIKAKKRAVAHMCSCPNPVKPIEPFVIHWVE